MDYSGLMQYVIKGINCAFHKKDYFSMAVRILMSLDKNLKFMRGFKIDYSNGKPHEPEDEFGLSLKVDP